MSTSFDSQAQAERTAWNEAHDRLFHFLHEFRLSDHAEISRLTLKFIEEAKESERRNPAAHPTTLTMMQMQKNFAEWLARNLESDGKPASQVFSMGCVALLLSRVVETAPHAFLAMPPPEELRQAMREILLVTGPDFQISSMTPRPLDYGPMLNLARQTWHRWSGRELVVALLFWIGVYFAFYWWLSTLL